MDVIGLAGTTPDLPMETEPDLLTVEEASQIPHVPWTFLGFALPGANGEPSLKGDGDLLPGTLFRLELSNAAPQAMAYCIGGFSRLDAPLKGGTLVPSPDILAVVTTSPAGIYETQGIVPPGFATGTTMYFQFWVVDPGGVKGFAASNGLSATSP